MHDRTTSVGRTSLTFKSHLIRYYSNSQNSPALKNNYKVMAASFPSRWKKVNLGSLAVMIPTVLQISQCNHVVMIPTVQLINHSNNSNHVATIPIAQEISQYRSSLLDVEIPTEWIRIVQDHK